MGSIGLVTYDLARTSYSFFIFGSIANLTFTIFYELDRRQHV